MTEEITIQDSKPVRSGIKPAMPVLGYPYLYGNAFIPESKRLKYSDEAYMRPNPMGWMLPGGKWTDSPKLVLECAIEIDRLISLCRSAA